MAKIGTNFNLYCFNYCSFEFDLLFLDFERSKEFIGFTMVFVLFMKLLFGYRRIRVGVLL